MSPHGFSGERSEVGISIDNRGQVEFRMTD